MDGFMIPIVAIVMGVAFAMLAVYFDHRKREMAYRERMVAIEKGLDLAALPPIETQAPLTPRRYLFRGLVWLAIGIGMVGFFATVPGEREALFLGLIPAFIGVAHLIFFVVEDRADKRS